MVGEGVEDEATLAALRERKCDVAQGYLYGKPMTTEAFQRWLDERGPAQPQAAAG